MSSRKKKIIHKILKTIRFFEKVLYFIKGVVSERQFIYISCVLVGISSAMAVIFLKTFAHWVYHIGSKLNSFSHVPYTFVILPIIGILLTVYCVRRLFGGQIERGTGQILKTVARRSAIMPKKQMYAQIITSSLTVGMGGSAGLESPITITGAAFGSNYAREYKLNYKSRTLLLACGVAAGIAAAFNAPITGVLFAIEIILVDVSVSAFIPLMIAAATGAMTSTIVLKENVLLTFSKQLSFNHSHTLLYVLFGILLGLFSVYHARMFRRIEEKIDHISPKPYRKALIGASLLALLIFVFPTLFGEGYEGIKLLASDHSEEIFSQSVFGSFTSNQWVIIIFLLITAFVKAIASGLTLGAGGNGGMFAPSLFVGSYLGFVFSKILSLVGFSKISIENFTVVGMAGVLSGLFHAPLTAIFLIAEITGGYGLMLPLLIVSSISFAISKRYEPYSMDVFNMVKMNSVFTSDKDKNILSKIRLRNLINSINHLSMDASIAEAKHIFEVTNQSIIPIENENHEFVGILDFHQIKSALFNSTVSGETNIVKFITPQPSISISSSVAFALKTMKELKTDQVIVTQNKKIVGKVTHKAIMENYRANLAELRVE